MKRVGFSLAIASLLLWPLAAIAQPKRPTVEPEERTAQIGQEFILSVGDVPDGKVLVSDMDPKIFSFREVLKGSHVYVITAKKGTEGIHVVRFWIKGESVTLPAKGPLPELPVATLTLTIGTPEPPKPPVPPEPPTPPAPVGPLTLVGITDNDNRTIEQAKILTDPALAKWLDANNVKWRVIDESSEAYRVWKCDQVLAKHGVTAPAVILYAGDSIAKVAAAPRSSDEVKKFVGLKASLDAGGEPDYFFAGGERRFLTRVPSQAKMFAAPRWTEAKNLVPRDQWRPINRRDVFPPGDQWTFDQDGHGSCVGQGAVGGLMRARSDAGMPYVKLSPTALYAQINGNSDNGAIIGDSLEALKRTGTITFEKFPQSKIYVSQLPAGWRDEAARFKVVDAFITPSFDEIASAIQLGYICVIGVHVGNNFDNFTGEGVAGVASGQGNHCVMADGMKRLANGKWALDVQNSWGTRWGDQGRYLQSEDHFRYGLDARDFYAIRGASEDQLNPFRPPASATPNQVIPSTMMPGFGNVVPASQGYMRQRRVCNQNGTCTIVNEWVQP
ncbi:MAG: hypothetical protein U0744_02645 [Gemmataceae bacterium]